MESGGGHRSDSGAVPGEPLTPGAGAEGGVLCHACGYQYPNAHPSAKQRRAHRRHCGRPAPDAAAEEEGGGTGGSSRALLVPGAGVRAGDGTGASAAERGGGSAREVDVDETEHSSSHDVAGSKVIVDKCVEDHSDIASGIITPETNRTDDDGTLNEGAMECSGKSSLPEEEVPSVPPSAIGSEQLQDVSVPVLLPEPGCGEGVSPELSVSKMGNSDVVSVASDATGGEISEQTNDAITEPNDATVTGLDGSASTTGKDIPFEEKSVKGEDLDSSCQENLQTKVGEGHINTAVEEDPSDKNLTAVQIKEIPNDKSESNQQSSPMLTSSTEVVPNTEDEEPFESGTQAPIGTDDFHSEGTDTVKPQEQPGSTSVAEDHLAVPEQAGIFEGEHCPNKDGSIAMISSAIGPAANAKVTSSGDADNMTKNVSSSDVTMGDTIQEYVTGNTVVLSQADLEDLSTSSTTHEINMGNSMNDVEEKEQDEKSVADLTTVEIKEVHITELIEEKQQDKEIVADSVCHKTNAFRSIDNYGENEKEIISEVSSRYIPSMSSIEEEKQVEEVTADPAPEKTNVTSNIDGVEENKQIEVDAKANHEINVVCTTEAIEEKDTSSEFNAENIIDNVEDKKQGEESCASDISDGTNMISTVNEEKMHNEDMTKDPSSNEKNVVHSTDNVQEKKYEESMVDPTSHCIGVVATVERVEERKNDETVTDLEHGINVAYSTDNVEEKDGDPILEPISTNIGTVGRVGDVDEKQNEEECTADQISVENNIPQRTYDAEKCMQNKDATTVLVSDKCQVEMKTDAVEGVEQNKETSAKEISTVSTDNLKGAGKNEEITDKEVIVDSDRSHVSLKVLLADKNVETKEKKPSTKDRVLSFRRRSSKDNESPVDPGSPKGGSGQQDWNSPARLPSKKKSKGKKQQWVPLICCSSIH